MNVVVSIHDVAPATLHRVVRLRDLVTTTIGAAPVSLLVVPRYHGDPRWDESSQGWVLARKQTGDEIVAHGLVHLTPSGRDGPEFSRSGPVDATTALMVARDDLRRMGFGVEGFIAPAYGHPPRLEKALRESGLGWWATRTTLRWGGGGRILPSVGLGASTPLRRGFSPLAAKGTAVVAARSAAIRLDLHPPDLDSRWGRSHVERLLDTLVEQQQRSPITHAALVGGTLAA